jgi:CBS-domain-containing membrane protein
MTTRILVATPGQTLAHFMERSLVEHSFQELPVVGHAGTFLGMAALRTLRSVPREKWDRTLVAAILDHKAKTICPAHSMAVAERELALGHHDYLPVVDPSTDQLMGIISSSDVLRARQSAQEGLRTGKTNIAIIRQQVTSNPENSNQ